MRVLEVWEGFKKCGRGARSEGGVLEVWEGC